MIGSQDIWVQMPTVDLYDTLMMLAAVNAARDMYNRSEERIKEFNEKYGDFTTPIIADQNWYNQEFGGKIHRYIDDIYRRGGDPLRNAQDRASMMMMINSLPYGDYAKIRTSAENAKEYLKIRGALEASGKYNSDLEERFLGYNLADWDTLHGGRGIWDRTSPTEMKTLKELTNDWYNNRTARLLTKDDLANENMAYDPRYEYYGFLNSDLMNIARNNTPGWNDSVYSRYYRDLAEQLVASRGGSYTRQDVENQLQRNIADAQQEWLMKPTRKVDEFAKADYEYNQRVGLENLRHKHAMDEAAVKNADKDPYGGGYLRGLGIDAKGQIEGLRAVLMSSEKRKNQLEDISKILDPKKRQQKLNTFNTNLMVDFLNTSVQGTGKNVYLMINSLGNSNNSGGNGRKLVNNILSTFAINSNNKLNGDVVLESIGCEPGDDAGTYRLPDDAEVVSPQTLLHRFIAFGSGDFKGKEDLLNTIMDNEDSSDWPHFAQSTTKTIANRTRVVKPTASYKGIIIAPDENGVDRLYMKVRTIGGTFEEDHGGFWVKLPPTYGSSGVATSDNTSLIQGSEAVEGKSYGNSQRKEAFENRR